ncbi:Acyl-CoA N-acyltransferase [Penicillium vulpinum]|uniref:Acyl-CoA N-acyltransferase n=1 Tax=Penicillium vulpinum TaxID=29845 RepID=UPI0025469889|nr:Acyl-CoA N-acyltransferase [Penicillium vulpinum]KAJ5950419.1 Acyl-CoA N-acyltransferase [Penicillium vulpinum]
MTALISCRGFSVDGCVIGSPNSLSNQSHQICSNNPVSQISHTCPTTNRLRTLEENVANNACVEQILHRHACPGDYDPAAVALLPDAQYRGRAIVRHLAGACDEEILRQHRVNGKDGSSPVQIMIWNVKENSGAYWLKQGFTVVGSQKCPKGVWNLLEEFTMWAMVRELSVI